MPIRTRKYPAACKTHQKKLVFVYGNSLYGPAIWKHTKANISDIPSQQPTENRRTFAPRSRVSEHMPRRPSCVCLPELSVSRAMATGALEASRVFEVIRLISYAVSCSTDQLMTPYFSGGSTPNGTLGGDRWARVLCGQIGWLSDPLHEADADCSGCTNLKMWLPEKQEKIRPTQSTPLNLQQPGDRDHLETAHKKTRPTR